ncbi:MAG: T9SS type A sorting domain-containing protein [Bacteroidota bacterium]
MNKQLLPSLLFLAFVLMSSNVLATVNWVGDMFPTSGSDNNIGEGENFTLFVQAYQPGVTEAPGQGAGVTCEVYFGEVSSFGQPWMSINTMTMNYNVDIGNNDEYIGLIAPSAGFYEFTCRCSGDGGTNWTFAALPSGNGRLTVSAPLPVELISWDAQVQRDAIALHWRTATEFNSSHFDIQRSGDLNTWKTIGQLGAKGNTLVTQNYLYEDAQPLPGTGYYRLLQVDFDGRSELSDVVAVKFQSQSQWLRAYPNPVRQQLRIDIASDAPSSPLHLQLFDATGRLLHSTFTNAADFVELDLADQPAGLYLLRLVDDAGMVLAQERVLRQ